MTQVIIPYIKLKLDETEKTKLYEDIYGIGSILSISYGRIFYETMIAEGGGYYSWINGLYSIKLDGTNKQALLEATYSSWALIELPYTIVKL